MSYNKFYNKKNRYKEVPIIPISAYGEPLEKVFSVINELEYEKIVSPVSYADFAITIAGDSMSPEYPSGSYIFVRKINEAAFIDWGKIYVIDTCNGPIIKKVMPSEKDHPDSIKCVSINPDYPSFEVSLSDICGLYGVVLCMATK